MKAENKNKTANTSGAGAGGGINTRESVKKKKSLMKD